MKTIQFKHIFALTIISLTIVSACKRGDEDPGLTFRSRNGRLTGTWELTEMASNSTTHREYSSNNTVNSDGVDSVVDISSEVTFSGGTLKSVDDRQEQRTVKSIEGTVFDLGRSAYARRQYSIPQISITFNDDNTFGITYEFKSEVRENCGYTKETLSSDFQKIECTETNEVNQREYSYSEPIVGTWHWVEGEVDEVQLGFEPLNRTMGDGFPETGFPMWEVVEGGIVSPLGMIFAGKMLRLSDKEIKFASEEYTDDTDATTIEDGSFMTDNLELNVLMAGRETIKTVNEESTTYSSTWAKVEE